MPESAARPDPPGGEEVTDKTNDVHVIAGGMTAQVYYFAAALHTAADSGKNSPEDAAAARIAASHMERAAWSMAKAMGTREVWSHVDAAVCRHQAPVSVVRRMAVAQAKTITNHRKEQG